MKAEKRDFNKEAATWDEPRRARMAEEIAEAICKEVRMTPDMDVMDFGCGTGLLTMHFQPLACTITGMDSSQGMLDGLRAKIRDQGLSNMKAVHVDLDKGDKMQGRYHVITSSMTLHHIKDIDRLIGQFYQIIVPGGHLCIADLDLDGGRFHGDNQDGVFHDGFDRAEMHKAFADAGFKEIHQRTATTVVKPVPGGTGEFTIFLTTGRK